MSRARFGAFLTAQFLGATVDNMFKASLISVVLDLAIEPQMKTRYQSIATALMPAAFLIFSPLAGSIADRFRKSELYFWTKMPEIFCMAIGIWAFADGHIPALLLAFFLVSIQATFFSPVKYGLLPEALPIAKLPGANAMLSATTNLAILLGSVLGGMVLYGLFKHEPAKLGWIYTAVAIAGTVLARFVPKTPPGRGPSAPLRWNVFRTVFSDFAEVRRHRELLLAMLGLTYFNFLGGLFLSVMPLYANTILQWPAELATGLLALIAIGIGSGSALAGFLSRGKIELGLVPLGSVGLTLFAIDLALFGASGGAYSLHFRDAVVRIPYRAIVDVLGLGLMAGIYFVPLTCLLQARAPEGSKGRFVAFSNILQFGGVFISAGYLWILGDVLGLGSDSVVLSVAGVTILASAVIFREMPQAFVRLIVAGLFHRFYRLRVHREDRLPKGGQLWVANHVSWVDAPMIALASERWVCFLMYRGLAESKALGWFFRRMQVIPVSGTDSPAQKEESLDRARRLCQAGERVAIFAEGAISRTGMMLPFKRGLERIAGPASVPIVPVYLHGVWGALFAYERGEFVWKPAKKLRQSVEVWFGEPLPPDSDAGRVREALQTLSREALESEVRRFDQNWSSKRLVRLTRESTLAEVLERWERGETLWVDDPSQPAGEPAYSQVEQELKSGVMPADVAFVIEGFGTRAAFTRGMLFGSALAAARALSLGQRDTVLASHGWDRVLGGVPERLAAHIAGARVVEAPSKPRDALVDLVIHERVTHWPMLWDEFSQAERGALRLKDSELRVIVLPAHEAIDWERVDAFEVQTGIDVIAGLGFMQTAGIVSTNVPDVERARQKGKRQGTGGHPVAGCEVRVVDQILEVRGPHVAGPHGPVADWWSTGFRAFVDRDGFVVPL